MILPIGLPSELLLPDSCPRKALLRRVVQIVLLGLYNVARTVLLILFPLPREASQFSKHSFCTFFFIFNGVI